MLDLIITEKGIHSGPSVAGLFIIHDIIGQVLFIDIPCRDHFGAYRMARAMHAARIAAHQGMPVGQVPAFSEQAVSAGFRNPGKVLHQIRGKGQAGKHQNRAFRVAGAGAMVNIQQFANHIGVVNAPRIFIFKLDDAALSATITQRLPFGA